jgi:micrococcal nuclease
MTMKSKPLKTLAGMGGFEPPNGGIKIVCRASNINARSDISRYVHGMRIQCFMFCVGMILAYTATAAPACRYHIIDGDTIQLIETGETIRIVGLDTPETGGRAKCESEHAAGIAAAEHLGVLCAPGNVVEVDRGPRLQVDRYDRTLATVRIGEADISDIMITGGFGRPYTGGKRDGWCSTHD